MSRGGYNRQDYGPNQGNWQNSSYGDNWGNPYSSPTADSVAVAMQSETARTRFLRLTYAHLFGAVVLFAALEGFLLFVIPQQVSGALLKAMAGSNWSWLIVMGLFMGVSWLATSWASAPSSSRGLQYAGLALYVVAESIIFLPLMWVAVRFYPDAVPVAGLVTFLIFAGITAMIFMTGANFGWLGRWLFFAGIGALAIVVAGLIFGFNLGLVFIGFMIALASGNILFHTSNVMHEYDEEQYVAASLALFASVATLFWYVLRLAMALRDRE